jgi:beta-glucanase (GH16 family)
MRERRLALAFLGLLLLASGEATPGFATVLPIVGSEAQPRQPLQERGVDRKTEVDLFSKAQSIAARIPAEARLPRARPTEKDGPFGHRGAWERTFTEEFDGTSLDTERWTTCYWWNKHGCTNLANKELQWYLPANVQVADGHLQLTARPEEVTGFDGRSFPYTSGMITTGRDYAELPRPPRVSIHYGYIEVRAKIPAGKGLWPALWLLPADRESKPEIDIMEVLGDRPNVLEMHFHYVGDDAEPQDVGNEAEVSDLSKDWHIYGLEWSPTALVWYLDGIAQWKYSDATHIPNEPMYFLANLAVGGNWPGDPDGETVFPADFLLDYIRIWRRATS